MIRATVIIGAALVALGWLGAVEYEDQQAAEQQRQHDERTQALIDAAMARYKASPEGREAVSLTYPVGGAVVYRGPNQ